MILSEKIIKDLPKDASALDIGFGSGRELVYLAQQGVKVSGIDKSSDAISNTSQKLAELGLEANLLQSDLLDYNFEPESFDIINCSFVLHFLNKEPALTSIEKIKRGIKKGGYFVLANFSEKDPEYKPERGYLTKLELENIFADWTEVYFEEITKDDGPHKGMPIPHKHGIIYYIAKK